MNKNFLLVFVLCVIAVSVFAEKQIVAKLNHHQREAIFNSPEIRTALKTGHPAFAHPQMEHLRRAHEDMKNHVNEMGKVSQRRGDRRSNVFEKITLLPGTTYVQEIERMTSFSVPYSKDDNIAVQIVRSSDMYDFGSSSPHLRRCSQFKKNCVCDAKVDSLSFEVSSEELAKRKGSYYALDFSLAPMMKHKFMKNGKTGVVVGIYVCVGQNASLATCFDKSAETRNCVHGTPSKIADVCVCDKGYTDPDCSKETSAPQKDFDSEEFDEVERVVCMIASFVCHLVFIFVLITIIFTCCACCRVCCCKSRRRNGAVVRNNAPVVANRSMPPPPPYVRAGSYHPLNIPPPPPPPPEEKRWDVYPGNAIEMTTLPAAKAANPNPVFIMPPLAPVRAVPVFVQPSAPKN